METYMLLNTLAFVAGLVVVLAEGFENIQSYKSVDLPLPFNAWINKEEAWKGSFASAHIAGGSEAVPYSYPHQIYLIIKAEKDDEKEARFCGGSILTDSWIVTAAHCVDKKVIFHDTEADRSSKYKLRLIALAGVHNTGEVYLINVQARNVSQIIIHPEWSLYSIKNDIALLKLEKNFVFKDYVKPIRLPNLSQQTESFRGSHVTMTGWGVTNRTEKYVAKRLNKVHSTVVSNLYCKFRYLFFLVKDTNICVSGWGAKGICKGDSGGPLIIREADGEPTLVGVASFDFGCTWGFPSVFTRVTSYLSWICSNTGIAPRI